MPLSDKTRGQLEGCAQAFFNALQELDIHDSPDVFPILDEYARKHDFMICAEQKGIFGTVLSFRRVSTWEK